MSPIEVQRSTVLNSGRSQRILVGIVWSVVVLLCLFGAYESIDASFVLIKRQQPSTGMKAFFDYPLWALGHFLPGLLFMILTPFQLWEGFRNRHRRVHRWSGRVVVASGVLLGVSGLGFPFKMPERPFPEKVLMTTFFTVFLFFLIKAFSAARRRDFADHREWMLRMFATGMTITTQRLLLAALIPPIGISDLHGFWDLFVTAAWLAWGIQIAIAEWWISRRKIEGGTPNALFRRGFTKDSLKTGTAIVVNGYRAKDGSLKGNGRDLTLPDGRKLFLGASGNGAPTDGRDPK